MWYPTEYKFPLNDIVVYLLDEPVNNIDPIAFNRVADLPSEGFVGRAIGFGLTTHQGSAPDILMQVDVKVVADSVCYNHFTDLAVPESELICVQEPDAQGVCQGDSGGPLFATVGDELTLLAITSFTGVCGVDPSGFAATSHFQDFIDEVSENVVAGHLYVLVLTMCGIPARQTI
jgi:secreted trypsin-like serine protease